MSVEDNDKKIMRGEFRGDFTRDTFDPMKAFSRVLMQQGRVQVDADWNEQVSILLHYMRNFNRDIGGPHWGPEEDAGFEIKLDGDNDFSIGAGHYYVNGVLCEVGVDQNEQPFFYSNQPDYPLLPEEQTLQGLLVNLNGNKRLLVYLDVWERHITYINDDTIREVALGGADTATRAQLVWQVKVVSLDDSYNTGDSYKEFHLFLKRKEIQSSTGTMLAIIQEQSGANKTPCLIAPESRYRGAENQLYRVEIHTSGEQGDATFKWSRENGAVIFPILAKMDSETTILTLEHLGRDDRFSLKPNNWVEIVDDDSILQNRAESLMQIESVDHENRQVTLKGEIVQPSIGERSYLRRWDQRTGDGLGIPLFNDKNMIDLEDGIQVKFTNFGIYQTGDYWLIPARAATGEIEWPKNKDKAKYILPHGVIHHYAPLAIITETTVGTDKITILKTTDLRRIIKYQTSDGSKQKV